MSGNLSRRLARVEDLAGVSQSQRTWVIRAELGTPLAKAIRDSGIDYRAGDRVMVLNWHHGRPKPAPYIIPDLGALLHEIDGKGRGLPNGVSHEQSSAPR